MTQDEKKKIDEMLEGLTLLLDWWQDKEGLPAQCAREQLQSLQYEAGPSLYDRTSYDRNAETIDRIQWLDSFCCLWETLEQAQQERK